MKVKARVLALAIVAVASLSGAATSDKRPKPLVGNYAISNTNIDPGPQEPRDSHLIINLQGEAAKSLFDAMKVPLTTRACPSADMQTKAIGGTVCYHDPKRSTYECDFAIDIAKQTIGAVAC